LLLVGIWLDGVAATANEGSDRARKLEGCSIVKIGGLEREL